MNPYLTDDSSEQVETERTVIIDPTTGEMITIGARIERTTIDVQGHERRDVMNIVVPSADGKQLLFPYNEPLYMCSVCGRQPLVHAEQCAACGRFCCDSCRVQADDAVICRSCDAKPLFARILTWLSDL